MITQEYFPFASKKKKLRLIPLLLPDKKQRPPFQLMFGDDLYGQQEELPDRHAFWVNKIDKHEVSEILSLQNVEKKIMIPYLISYLREHTLRRQRILREFQIIPYLITVVIPEGELTRECYQLLFFICKSNPANKRKCLQFVDRILVEEDKQLILDLLTELLTE